MKYDSDSAKHYALLCQEVASRADMPNLEVSAMLDRAYIMILCGELIDAQRILNHISTPVENMPEDVQMWRHRARLQLCHAVHRFRLPPTVLRPSSASMPSSAWASPTASALPSFCIIRRRPFTIIVCVCAITHAYPRRTLPTPSHRCMPTNSSAIRSESSVCRDCRTICAC